MKAEKVERRPSDIFPFFTTNLTWSRFFIDFSVHFTLNFHSFCPLFFIILVFNHSGNHLDKVMYVTIFTDFYGSLGQTLSLSLIEAIIWFFIVMFNLLVGSKNGNYKRWWFPIFTFHFTLWFFLQPQLIKPARTASHFLCNKR